MFSRTGGVRRENSTAMPRHRREMGWRQKHGNMAEEEHNETDAVFLHLAGRNSLTVLVPKLWRIFWRRKNQAMYSCCARGPSEFSISYVFVYSAGSILLRSMDVILYRFESPRTPSRMWADSFFDFYIFSNIGRYYKYQQPRATGIRYKQR